MEAIELGEHLEVRRFGVPAWLKVGFYTVLGAFVYTGGLEAYEQATRAYMAWKHSYVMSIVDGELNRVVGDLNDKQVRLRLFKELKFNESCEGTMLTINTLSNNIEVAK